jgi:hypothetical protein
MKMAREKRSTWRRPVPKKGATLCITAATLTIPGRNSNFHKGNRRGYHQVAKEEEVLNSPSQTSFCGIYGGQEALGSIFLKVFLYLFELPTWYTIPLFCNICITLNTSKCFEQYHAHLQEVKIIFLQHLISSLGLTVHRLRAECIPLNRCTVLQRSPTECGVSLCVI